MSATLTRLHRGVQLRVFAAASQLTQWPSRCHRALVARCRNRAARRRNRLVVATADDATSAGDLLRGTRAAPPGGFAAQARSPPQDAVDDGALTRLNGARRRRWVRGNRNVCD